jgi:hypothetical protein
MLTMPRYRCVQRRTVAKRRAKSAMLIDVAA